MTILEKVYAAGNKVREMHMQGSDSANTLVEEVKELGFELPDKIIFGIGVTGSDSGVGYLERTISVYYNGAPDGYTGESHMYAMKIGTDSKTLQYKVATKINSTSDTPLPDTCTPVFKAQLFDADFSDVVQTDYYCSFSSSQELDNFVLATGLEDPVDGYFHKDDLVGLTTKASLPIRLKYYKQTRS